jgi:hypothetical protein
VFPPRGVKITGMTIADVAVLDQLTKAFLDAVSFRAGESPSYESIRAVFVDGGRLVRNTGDAPEVDSVDTFIAPRQLLVDSGELTEFREDELGCVTEVFGHVAHRLSGYAKSGVSGGVAFQARGVISTQFALTADGWRMVSMIWDDERPGATVPEFLLLGATTH